MNDAIVISDDDARRAYWEIIDELLEDCELDPSDEFVEF